MSNITNPDINSVIPHPTLYTTRVIFEDNSVILFYSDQEPDTEAMRDYFLYNFLNKGR